ncbi:isoleucine--tRNA ligase [Buchnera aphidicola]|uniref:isoleucine--tRNA ligase n=1 Tax=Buchnera aphidicola TaxID=9 RepID=UPI0031B858B3
MNNIKKTLNLPKTKFSMKGNLIKKEPKIIKKWLKEKIYQKIKKKNKKKKSFILYDGPPYANGNIHIGHALNKILKDIIIKSKNLSGFNSLYKPSWDCHGLPIEHKIELYLNKNKKKKISDKKFRKYCKKYAKKNIKKQKEDFIKLGIIGKWHKPNLTMSFNNQSNIILTLSKIIKKGYLYKDYKPVYWCIKCKSSLAEAEIEYFNKYSPGIIVLFQAKNKEKIKKIFKIKNKKINIINIIIWTTTPWTLPSNVGIAINPNIKYQLIKTKLYTIILAKKVLKKTMKKLRIKKWTILSTIIGKKLEFIKFIHPFLKNYIPIILSKYVTEKIGTGAVHTSPDHGQEDFIICKKYKINTKNLIKNCGKINKNIHPLINKKNILKINKIIIDILIKNKKIINLHYIKHNYPHCWRHKFPIIFRATIQWFINMNKNKLRKKCLKLIKNITWIPHWGYEKMKKMLENRPDWCISRQRKWGIPLTIFINKKTGKIHPKTEKLTKKIAKYVKKKGTEKWWSKNIIKINKKKYKKIKDVLDVWFESGSLYIYNLKSKKNKNIGDIYLEGSDQYRGWFMSSLIISTIVNNKAPYKKVLTHGFTIDEKGYKMSKSSNNAISPNFIIENYGADVLRLLIASTNYCNDITISKKIIKQSITNYKKIRNTIRFLIANLKYFNNKKNSINENKMVKIDKWIILETKKLQKKIILLYNKYQFHKIIKHLMNFISIKLSSFYLDIIKDRQYTLNIKNNSRYSCQKAIFYILNVIVRLISPILSFTSEEIWKYLQKKKNKKNIFTEKWFLKNFIKKKKNNNKFWKKIILIKNEINKIIEIYRNKKKIKSSLEASIILYTNKNIKKKIQKFKKEKKFLFIVSNVKIKKFEQAPKNAIHSKNIKKLKIIIKKNNGKKCQRCWNYVKKIIIFKNKNKICKRCILNLFGLGEKRKFL